MVKTNDISIVVQGPVTPGITRDVLQSVRETLPGGEIILSTWRGTDVSGLVYDKVVFCDDPGAIIQDTLGEVYSNLNRQIVSSRCGLEQAGKPYALKLRTDIILRSASFLEEFQKWDRIASPLHVKNRMLLCNYYTRNPRVFPLPFHASDWVLFGNTEEVRNYFSPPLEDAEEIQWFCTHKRKKPGFYSTLLARYVPEQYLCINFLQQFEPVQFECFDDATEANIIQTERMLAGDFVVLDYRRQFNIFFAKYHPNKIFQQYSLLSHREWRELFQEYCLHHPASRWKRYLCCFCKRRILTFQKLAICLVHTMRLRRVAKCVINFLQRKNGYTIK